MQGPLFLTLEHVLWLHSRQIDRFGGDPGIRDVDLIASAIAQPQAEDTGSIKQDRRAGEQVVIGKVPVAGPNSKDPVWTGEPVFTITSLSVRYYGALTRSIGGIHVIGQLIRQVRLTVRT